MSSIFRRRFFMPSIMIKVLIIILITAITPAVTYFVLVRDAQTTYSANGRILFDQPQLLGTAAGANSITKIIQLLPTYGELIRSYSIAQKASELSGISPEEIQASLSAEPLGDQTLKTQILSLEAKSTDPQKAVDIVTASAQALTDYVTNMQNVQNTKPEDRLVLTIIDPPSGAYINGSGKMRTLALAAITAFIISTGGVLVFEDFRRA